VVITRQGRVGMRELVERLVTGKGKKRNEGDGRGW